MNRRDKKVQRGLTLIDEAIFEEDPERFRRVLACLMGYDAWYATAVLETRSREVLNLFPADAWAFWLTLAPESCRFPLSLLALRAQYGPEHGNAPPTTEHNLLNARDYVDRSLWKAHERERKAKAEARLERRRQSRGR